MLAQQFAGHALKRTTLAARGGNVTAYAAGGADATHFVAIFNKDGRDARITIADPAVRFTRAAVARLEAPSIDAKDGVKFQGSTVKSDGQFLAYAGEPLQTQSGKLLLNVPAYSAALIRLG